MTSPSPSPTPPAAAPSTTPLTAPVAAATERGWGKLLLAILAFLVIPTIPQMRAFLPIEQMMLLFVPGLAACALVGWWAGGRVYLAVAWVGIAVLLTMQGDGVPDAFFNLARGWSLLIAGSFGLVCLFDAERPVFGRALVALGLALVLGAIISLLGPVSLSTASATIAAEFSRRNAETMAALNAVISSHPKEWHDITTKLPQMASLPAETEKQLRALSRAGLAVFPALLALESLAALALGWATYHRLGRARLGAPLGRLKEFRFNDQLVWGLIVGLTIVLLPTLTTVRGLGKNLLVFFGALYAMRGLGVLTWFMAPSALVLALLIGFAMLPWPVLNAIAVLTFMLLGITALALGLGDTWADWRSRARSST